MNHVTQPRHGAVSGWAKLGLADKLDGAAIVRAHDAITPTRRQAVGAPSVPAALLARVDALSSSAKLRARYSKPMPRPKPMTYFRMLITFLFN